MPGGRGLSDALGVAGFTNLDVVRNTSRHNRLHIVGQQHALDAVLEAPLPEVDFAALDQFLRVADDEAPGAEGATLWRTRKRCRLLICGG